MLEWLIFGIIGIYAAYLIYIYAMRKMYAKTVTSEEFSKDLRHVQLIDLREKDEYKRAHILGARNIPYSQLKQRIGEIRKDQPVYVYETGASVSGRAAYHLKKHGVKEVVVLKGGFASWNGKIKKSS